MPDVGLRSEHPCLLAIRAPYRAVCQDVCLNDECSQHILLRMRGIGDQAPLAAGDLAKPRFGLKPEVYSRLAAEVDTIVHNGALVNHAFSYRQLFEPNVLGTVEVMRLAITTRVKALTFISSVGVVGGLDHPAPVSEEEVGTKLAMELPGDGGYALGCALPRSWVLRRILAQRSAQHHVEPVSMMAAGQAHDGLQRHAE